MAAAAILLLNILPAYGFLPLPMPHTSITTSTSSSTSSGSSTSFGKRMQVMVGAASKKGGGLRGDIRRGGGNFRPTNDSSSSSAFSTSFDPKNPFYTSEFGEEEEEEAEKRHIEDLIKDAHKQAQAQAQGATTNVNETEEEKERRLAEEEEFMAKMSKDDPDGYTETFSSPQDRAKRAKETKDRYDFTCMTVEEVARSYQVPISWLGDALCNFGVVPPIQWTARMGDLIDGEQAFAILEAMHGWDHAIMYDMYTWDSLRELAASHELEIADVLQVCDEEGFALPFGLRSHLRVEQYARLMRRLGLASELPDHIKEQCPDPDYPSV